MNLDEALAVARYFGSTSSKTGDETRCFNEALRIIHIEAKKTLVRFVSEQGNNDGK